MGIVQIRLAIRIILAADDDPACQAFLFFLFYSVFVCGEMSAMLTTGGDINWFICVGLDLTFFAIFISLHINQLRTNLTKAFRHLLVLSEI